MRVDAAAVVVSSKSDTTSVPVVVADAAALCDRKWTTTTSFGSARSRNLDTKGRLPACTLFDGIAMTAFGSCVSAACAVWLPVTSSSRHFVKKTSNKQDGVAVFWKADKLKVKRSKTVSLDLPVGDEAGKCTVALQFAVVGRAE